MLGDQIKKLRCSSGLSQTSLAKSLSCSKQAVCNWENENIMPSVDVLMKIACFFGCSTDYLLELDSRTFIETTNLTDVQTAHIQQIVRDFEYLNQINLKKGMNPQTLD